MLNLCGRIDDNGGVEDHTIGLRGVPERHVVRWHKRRYSMRGWQVQRWGARRLCTVWRRQFLLGARRYELHRVSCGVVYVGGHIDDTFHVFRVRSGFALRRHKHGDAVQCWDVQRQGRSIVL